MRAFVRYMLLLIIVGACTAASALWERLQALEDALT